MMTLLRTIPRMWFHAPLAAVALLAFPVAADPAMCPDPLFSVASGDTALADKICELAVDVGDRLAACGLVRTEPLMIEVVDGLSHPMGECIAYFDCERGSIRLTDPALYASLLDPDVIYAILPPEITLRALLTHELAHAAIDQMAEGRTVPLVDHEYIAAAMELDLMEPKWREAVIAAAPVALPPKPGLVDIFIYYLAPRKFAVNAWQHFSLPENGCGLVRRMVAGEMTFELPRP